MTLQELITEIPRTPGFFTQGDLQIPIAAIAYDSRQVRPGSLFAALPGGKADGHDFIPQALERGAVALLAQNRRRMPAEIPGVCLDDARAGLARVAARFFGDPSKDLKVVGVTGTNGKTTITYLIEHILRGLGLSTGVTGTVNYRYGEVVKPSAMTTPESLDYQSLLHEMLHNGVACVISEVSSHALQMHRCEAVHFDVALFTNLSRDHLEFHGDMEAYFQAKARLFVEHLAQSRKTRKYSVVFLDDEYGRRLQKMLQKNVLTYSIENEAADFFARDIEYSQEGISAKLQTPSGKFDLRARLLGRHNLGNLLGSLAVIHALGLDIKKSIQTLREFSHVPGRLQMVANSKGKTILVDYAHTPDALEKVLGTLRPLVKAGRHLFCLFGCGGDRDPGKRPLMGEIAARLADQVVVTSDNPRSEDPDAIIQAIVKGIPPAFRNFQVEADRKKAISLAIGQMRPGDILVIAGKGHENYQIIGAKRLEFDDVKVAEKCD